MSVLRFLGLLLGLAALGPLVLTGKPDKPDKTAEHEWRDKYEGSGKPDHGPPPPIGAPEIDPGSLVGGLTLLVGGSFILADGRRRTRAQLGVD